MKFPILETNKLVLNEIIQNDIEALYELFSNDEVTKYYDLESFQSLQQAEDLIKLVKTRFTKSLGIRWAIRLKGTEKCIGTCGFNSWNQKSHSATIGYDLNKEHWGKGITSEALYGIIQTAFNGMLPCNNINRIQADTVPGNFASEAVLKKLGFKEEGILRQSGYWKNSYHDLKCFSLLRNEFNIKI